jgi:DNA-binding CsgD family transcriptional regulator
LGADDDLIGDCLGIDAAGVSTLIEIGRRKLASERRSKERVDLSDPDPDSSPTRG